MYENLSKRISDRHLEAMKIAINMLSKKPYVDYIEAIYLFGSCARGEQKYHSDVDLLVQCREDVLPETIRSMSIAVMPEKLDLPEVELKFIRKYMEDKK